MANTEYNILKGQNIYDIAVTNYGSDWLKGIQQIIEHNEGISMATELEAGTVLEIKNVNENDLSLQYLKAREIDVVTGQYMMPVPDKPTNLQLQALSSTSIKLTWIDESNNETGFEIYRRLVGGVFVLIHTTDENAQEYTDTDNLQPDTEYEYHIRAINADDESDYTPVATVRTRAIGIEFDGENDVIQNLTENIVMGDNSTGNFTIGLWLKGISDTQSGVSSDGFFWLNEPNSGRGFNLSRASNTSAKELEFRLQSSSFNTLGSWKNINDLFDGKVHYLQIDKITHDATNWKAYFDDIEGITSVSSNQLANEPNEVISFNQIRIGRNWKGYGWNGLIGWVWIAKPEFTQSQRDFMREGGEPNTPEARAVGLGIYGIDTVGVSGITCLIIRWIKLDQITESGGNYFVRDEVTDTNDYAQMYNFADVNDALKEYSREKYQS